MKTEHEFNKYLSHEIKLLGTNYKAVKTSDRFKVGLPDWLIISDGKAAVAEAKFIKVFPKKGKLLKHEVSGPQLSSLKSFQLAGTSCWVLIGAVFKGEKLMYLIHPDFMPSGNITVEEFEGLNMDGFVHIFDWNEVKEMVNFMLTHSGRY